LLVQEPEKLLEKLGPKGLQRENDACFAQSLANSIRDLAGPKCRAKAARKEERREA
jgi:hypothetical protein